MRKKIVMLLCLSFPVVLFALNENEMDWRYGIYGVRVVTNAPSRAEMAVATNALAQSIIGFVYSPSNPPPAQSSAFATNAITVIGPQSNDIASAIAHVADTNLHIAAGERQRIASALTNAAEFASATGGLWTAAAAALDGKAATNDSRIVNALQPASTNGWTVSPHEAWLTSAPPLADVLAAGNIAGEGITITNSADGHDFRTVLQSSGVVTYLDDEIAMNITSAGVWIKDNPVSGIYIGDDPVVYGVSVNGQEAQHGDVALTIPSSEDMTNAAQAVAAAAMPTNAVSGWMLYDAGSNVWLTVSVSNLSFTVWEILK